MTSCVAKRTRYGNNTVLSGKSYFDELLPECLTEVFLYLDSKDKGSAAQVCSRWRDILNQKVIWHGAIAKIHLKKFNPAMFRGLVKRGIKKVQILSLRRSLRDVAVGVPGMTHLSLQGCYSVTDKSLITGISIGLPHLQSLNLSLCKQISDYSLSSITKKCPNLLHLDLAGCNLITNSGLGYLAQDAKQLESLNLRSLDQLTPSGLLALVGSSDSKKDGLLHLKHLELQDCACVTDEALQQLSEGLPALETLNLSFCHNLSDSALKHLQTMSNLRTLQLRSCDYVTDMGVAQLCHPSGPQPSIEELDLSFCVNIGDNALCHMSLGMPQLRSLSVNACRVSDTGIKRLVGANSELRSLNIGQCSKVSDEALIAIGANLTQLHSIDLYGCTNITNHGLEKIMALPKIKSLNLGLWHKP